MEGMTTDEHADQIAESIINGQHKQAVRLWHNAIADHCDTRDLAKSIIENSALVDSFAFFARVIEDLQETIRKNGRA